MFHPGLIFVQVKAFHNDDGGNSKKSWTSTYCRRNFLEIELLRSGKLSSCQPILQANFGKSNVLAQEIHPKGTIFQEKSI